MSEVLSLRFLLLVFFLVFLIFKPFAARADVTSIEQADREIWGAFGGSFLNYKESVPAPDLPDSEHGWMPSAAVGISVLFNNAKGIGNNIYFSLEASGTFGTTRYNGSLLATPTVPYQSTTNDTMATVDGKIGKGFPIASIVMLTPYAELGYRHWGRELQPKEEEDYHNYDLLAGLMVQVSPISNLVLTAYGSGGNTFSSGMTFSSNNYSLGDSFMYKIGGKIGYLMSNIEIFTTLDFDHFRYGQSPVLSDFTYEPSSRTSDTIMRVGIGYTF